jgi:hypothetical protein
MTGVRMDPVLAALIEALKVALAQTERRALFVQVLYSDSTSQLIPLPSTVNIPEENTVPQGTDGRPLGGRRRAAVLSALENAEKPLKGTALAARAGVRYDSHFRELMGELIREEKVIHAPRGGYWLKGRPLPEQG